MRPYRQHGAGARFEALGENVTFESGVLVHAGCHAHLKADFTKQLRIAIECGS